jgi:dUTPase
MEQQIMKNKLIIDHKVPVQFLSEEEYQSLKSEKSLPIRKTERAAGYDVVAIDEPEIVGEKNPITDYWTRIDYVQYRTGIKLGPSGPNPWGEKSFIHFLAFPRSSVSKYNLVLANSIGVIDNDYRGEVFLRFKYIWQPKDLVIHNMDIQGIIDYSKIYKKGDAICQLVPYDNVSVSFYESETLTYTVRGEGGFGHTDNK